MTSNFTTCLSFARKPMNCNVSRSAVPELAFVPASCYNCDGIRVVSPWVVSPGRFALSRFALVLGGGSIRPYKVSRFARRSIRPWVVSPKYNSFYRGTDK